MAEAVLDLDITPALAAIDEINDSFSSVVDNFGTQLDSSLTSVIDDLGTQLSGEFSGVGEQLSADLEAAVSSADFSNLDFPGLSGANDELSGLSENLDSVGEASGEVQRQFNLQEGASTALEGATSVLSGSTGGLLRTLVPGIAIFGGITAAISGLVEKGDKAILATERMNQVFGDQAPSVFSTKVLGLNLSLEELDKKAGVSNNALKLAIATFGQTAQGAGATREEAARVSTQMGALANAVTILNPTLGTADQNFQLLTRGLGGSTRVLQRYGITIDPVQQKIKALEIAHQHGRETVTLYDKQVAGATLALEAMQKQAAANGTTLEQELNKGLESSTIKFRALKQEVSGALTEIGKPLVTAGLAITEALTPAITGVIGLFGDLVAAALPAVVPIAEAFSNILVPAIARIRELIVPLTPVWKVLGNAIAEVVKFGGFLVNVFFDIAGAIARVATPFVLGFFKGVGEALHTIVDAAKDVVTWVGDKLTNVLGANNPLVQKFADSSGDVGEKLGKAAVVAGGAYLSFKAITEVMTQVGGAIQGVVAGIELFSAGTGILGTVIGVLAVGAGAFYLLYQNSESFRKVVDDLWQLIQDNVLPVLKEVVTVIGDNLAIAFQVAGDYVSSFLDLFNDVDGESFFQGLSGAAQTARDTLVGLFSDIKGAWHDVQDAFSGGLKPGEGGGAIGVLTDAGHELIDVNHELSSSLAETVPQLSGLGDALGPLALLISPIGTALAVLYEKVEPVRHLFDRFITAVQPFIKQVGSQLAPVIERLASKFDEVAPKVERIVTVFFEAGKTIAGPLLIALGVLIDFLSNELGPVFDFLGETITTTLNAAVDVITGFVDIIVGILSLFIDILTGNWSAAWDDVKQIVRGALTAVEGFISLILGTVINTINLVLGTIGAIFRTAWDNVKQTVNNALSSIYSTITNILNAIVAFIVGQLNAIRNFFTNAWNALVFVVTTVWNNITNAVRTGISNIVRFVSELPGKLINAIGDVATKFFHVGEAIMDGLWKGLKAAAGKVTGFIDNLVDKIKKIPVIGGLFGSPSPFFIEVGNQMMNGLAIGVNQGANAPLLATTAAVDSLRVAGSGALELRGGSSGSVQAAAGAVHAPVTVQVTPHPGMTRGDAEELGRDVGAAASREIIATIRSI